MSSENIAEDPILAQIRRSEEAMAAAESAFADYSKSVDAYSDAVDVAVENNKDGINPKHDNYTEEWKASHEERSLYFSEGANHLRENTPTPIEPEQKDGPEFIPVSNLFTRSITGNEGIPSIPEPGSIPESERLSMLESVVKSIYPQIDLDESAWEQVKGGLNDILAPFAGNPAAGVIAGGVRDLGQGVIDLSTEASRALEIPGLIYNQDGSMEWIGADDPRYKTLKPIQLPQIKSADDPIAHLARGMTQFFAGFGALGGMTKGAGLLKNLVAGAGADATFDPEFGNLSTLLREQFNVDNALVDYLDSKVGEDADALERLQGRVKTVLEGGALGAFVPAVLGVLRGIKKSPEAVRKIRGLIEKEIERSLSMTDRERQLGVLGYHGTSVIDGAKPLEGKVGVINEYARSNPTAFNKIFKSGKQKISRKKFEAGDPDTIERVYSRVASKLEATQRHKAQEAAARNKSPDTRYHPDITDIENELKMLGYEIDRGPKIPGEEQFGGVSITEFDGVKSYSSYYKHPDTGVTVRLSDHPPTHLRSSRELMIHSGAFDSRDDVIRALREGSRGADPRPVAPKSAGLPDMAPMTPERELYQSVMDGKVTADDFFFGKPETEFEQRMHGAIEQRIKDVSDGKTMTVRKMKGGKMVESEKELTLPTSITGLREIAHTLIGETIDGKKMSKAALSRQVDEMFNPDKQRLMMPQEPRAAELKHLVFANGEKVRAERTEILSSAYGDKAPVKGMRPEGTVTFKDIKRAVHATVQSGAVGLKTAKKVLEETYGIKKLMKSNLKMEKAQVGYKQHGVNKAREPLLMPDGRGVETTGLSLYHAYKEAKISICPKSASCVDNCLATTSGGNRAYGGGADRDALKGPRRAHFMQNQAFIRDPEAFIAKMDDEVGKAWAAAQRNGNQLGIRLNVLSDVPPTVYEDLIKKYPDVQFYDYTKLHSNKPVAPNHHLTYSSTGTSNPGLGVINPHQNWRHMTKKLDEGHNVAMPFTVSANEPLPKFVKDVRSGKTYKVIDGDVHDYRPADNWGKTEGADGYIVGLRNKDQNLSGASRKKAVESSKGFFTYYDPAKGDTAEIAAQSAKGTGDMSKVVLPSAAFLMQFPHWEKYNPELAAELEQGT